MTRQFVLDVTLPEESGFASFVAGENAVLVSTLRDLARGHGENQVYLFGEQGTGKTHLLQAVCHEAADHGLRAAYLPPQLLVGAGAGSLEGLENLDVVCLDGIGTLCGRPDRETALFNLINNARLRNTRMVLSDRQPPRALSAGLPDMLSRLVWGPVFQVFSLDDSGRLRVLMERARHRGFQLPEEVARYLLNTSARDLGSLLRCLGSLETASLRDHRLVTLPFARSVLGEGRREV